MVSGLVAPKGKPLSRPSGTCACAVSFAPIWKLRPLARAGARWQNYSWIVARNQRGFVDKKLDNAKVCMYNVFQVTFAKPPDKNAPKENKEKDDNT